MRATRIPPFLPFDATEMPAGGRSTFEYASIAEQRWHEAGHKNVRMMVVVDVETVPAHDVYVPDSYGKPYLIRTPEVVLTSERIVSNLVNGLPPIE